MSAVIHLKQLKLSKIQATAFMTSMRKIKTVNNILNKFKQSKMQANQEIRLDFLPRISFLQRTFTPGNISGNPRQMTRRSFLFPIPNFDVEFSGRANEAKTSKFFDKNLRRFLSKLSTFLTSNMGKWLRKKSTAFCPRFSKF